MILVTANSAKAGNQLMDTWMLPENKNYHFHVYGPNGFFCEFLANAHFPSPDITCEYERTALCKKSLTGNVEIKIRNRGGQKITVTISDNAYNGLAQTKTLHAGEQASIVVDLSKSSGWYDFSVKVQGQNNFERRYAGRVETGKVGITDPAMGRVV